MQDTVTPSASPSPSRGFALAPRLRAAGIHLGLSALVALLAAALVFGMWYPWPFGQLSGGQDLFVIVVAVDVVLGPLITFTVFDRRKPWSELRRDLAVVALLQLAGLAYGLHAVFVARPVVVALEGDRLRVVRAIDLDEAELRKAPPELQSLSVHGVRVVATRQPQGEEKLKAIDMAMSGIDIGMRPEFWLPLADTAPALARAGRPLAELQRRYPERAAELVRYVKATGRDAEQLKFLPVLARRSDWVALVDASTGALVGYAPFDGF